MEPPRLEVLPTGTLPRTAEKEPHLLVLLPKSARIARDIPGRSTLRGILKRRETKAVELASAPVVADLPAGGRACFAMLDEGATSFARLTVLRKAVSALLEENPASVALWPADGVGADGVAQAVFVLAANGMALPSRKRKTVRRLSAIRLYGRLAKGSLRAVDALVRGNHLCRTLTALPANELTPGAYRKRIRALARENGWEHEEFDLRRLRRMGAGAFCAVAQGSPEGDAAIVRVSLPGPSGDRRIALVGKGICHDTGGHNLKPARHMAGMHEDMNGSAVALGLLLAATRARLPVGIDCWLAIARNDISPAGYRQNDVIRALDGSSIEIVHTDAEGRLVLADALVLAGRHGRRRPELLVDFATLTGSMHTALGNRYSGVFASSEGLADEARAAGAASGERVCPFPMDEDYEAALDSKVADVRQCTMEGEADHILAARFLGRFVGEIPWLHVDLSASTCPGGLAGIAGDVTGFGVGWGLALLGRRYSGGSPEQV